MTRASPWLALTTSTRRGGAALLEGDRLLAEVPYDGEAAHAERALPAIQEVLALAGLERRALAGIACDLGPGSFTGVRAGVALAHGIALALALPTVGVGSLEALAAAACAEQRAARALALLDARRGEVFAAVYDAAGNAELSPELVALADLPSLVARFPGAVVVGEVEPDALVGHGLTFALPTAAWVGRVALRRATRSGPLDPAYVRGADAKTMAEQHAARALR